jgi:hypothetical protein
MRQPPAVLSLVVTLASAGCAGAREAADAPGESSALTAKPTEPATKSTGGIEVEVGDPAALPSPEVEEGSSPQAWQACRSDDECTVRFEGCCSPCGSGGYVSMRVDHAKILAASCRREPVACPACAAPIPPPAVCAGGFCALQGATLR